MQNLKAFLYTNNEISETETRKENFIYYSYKNNTVLRKNRNQGGKQSGLRKLQNTEDRNLGIYK